MDIKDLRELHDKAYTHGQAVRERASDDLVFYHVTQWDDQTLSDSQLSYRGEFNMLRKATGQILAEMHSNPAYPNFEPIDETREDSAEIMDGMWRKDAQNNKSKEAFNNAAQEAVVCGVGAWKLVNEYRTKRDGTTEQVINRYPIYEANNNSFWDPNAKAVDKSDADYHSELIPMSPDAYCKLYEELTGEESGYLNQGRKRFKEGSSFAFPQQSYSFPWFNKSDVIYLVSFHHRKKVKRTFYQVQTALGEVITVSEETMMKVQDEMEASGDTVIDEKVSEVYEVTRYLASGEAILEETKVPGECIPVVPEYGHRAFIEGEENYEGVVRIAKDPQRFRNFQMSYLADILSRSPRRKPIYLPEQIQGFEHMYEENGAENNYPYLLQQKLDASGQPLPLGPVGEMPEQPIPQSLIAALPLTREAVEDVISAGAPQDIADPDLSGKAVYALQNQINMTNYEFQEKRKFAIRRDAEIYASMASEVYDTPRDVILELPNGSRKTVQTMQMVLDEQTGEMVFINDLSNAAFEVYAEIGPAYSSVKQQTRQEIIELAQSLDPNDPLRKVMILKYVNLASGDDMQDVRDYARQQLIQMGIVEPETDEEMQMLAMMQQQQQQPDAMTLAAQAELLKGQADVMDAQTKQMDSRVKAYDAETKRLKVQVDAQETGFDIRKKQAETQGVRIDNVAKLRGSIYQQDQTK